MSATSRAYLVRGIWRTTRHTEKTGCTIGLQYTIADCRPTNQVSEAERVS